MLAHGSCLLAFVVHWEKQMKASLLLLFEPCLPPPLLSPEPLKTKQKQFLPWFPLKKMPNFTIYTAFLFEFLFLQDLLWLMASFVYQKIWVYSAMQWSPDSAKCLGPCLILSLWTALLVLSRCFRDIWLKTFQKNGPKTLVSSARYLQKMPKTHQYFIGAKQEKICMLTSLTVLRESPKDTNADQVWCEIALRDCSGTNADDPLKSQSI